MEIKDELELPDWMKPIMDKQTKENISKRTVFSDARIKVSHSQPKGEKHSTVRCNTFYDIAEWCEKLLNKADDDILILGLDLDWPSAYKSIFKTKQIHICSGENECAILNVAEVDSIPRSLALLLNHSNVIWLGFNIHKDIAKLGKDFSLVVDEIISRLQNPEDFDEVKLSCRHHWSVKLVIEKGFKGPEGIIKQPETKKFKFNGLINYTNTVNDCGAVCEKLLSIAKLFPKDSKLVFGFDVEWPFTYKAGPGGGKVALIQMCPEKRVCFLFHVSSFKSLPKTLVLLLKHPRVKLTGLNIANDIRKIGRDFRIDVTDILQNNLVELCTLANKKLNVSHRWSLDGLVLNQLNVVLEKPKDVRISNWAANRLKKEQVMYAAADAYASLAVYNYLMKTESPNILSLLN
ncbi:3'-5' exonuclease [Halyomorpha halys]|uniref:3'-5' exonuclease n=1 Tax=Halyomorpha halys TaxID=286706 RepID=UPI0006D50DCB|nr:Werner Syndrome-like exonuclease [Halyomorpha halys]